MKYENGLYVPKQTILTLANTEAGKHLIGEFNGWSYGKDELIIDVEPNFVRSFIGSDGKRDYFRTRFFFNDEVYRNLTRPLLKIQLAREAEESRKPIYSNDVDFYKEYLHHASLIHNQKYPHIYLNETNFSSFLGGAGRFDNSDADWATCRGAATSDLNYADYEVEANNDYRIQRVALPCDTSSLPDTDNIYDFNFEGNFKNEGGYTNSVIHSVQTTQASPTSRDNNDYNNFGFTSGGSDTCTSASFVAYVMNADTSWVSKTGNTLVGVISGPDQSNTAPTSSGDSHWVTLSSPNLEVIHSSIKKLAGITYANLKKVGGVAIANVKKVGGVE